MDDEQETEETPVLTERMNQVYLGIQIATSLLGLAYLVLAIDEMRGGWIKRDLEARWEAWKRERREQERWSFERKKVLFEAWMALQEGASP